MPLPTTTAEILATANIDPDFAQALKEKPLPSHPGITISTLKAMVNTTLSTTQSTLAASRPPSISETTHQIPTRDGALNRTLIARPTTLLPSGSPLIILLHGGGHCFGFPEMELPLARRLVTSFSAICILPSYRLAPEYPSPTSSNDCWDTLQWVAKEASAASSVLPSANPKLGFIIGGTSAGGGIASSLAHLARDHNLTPPLTGQMNCIGSVMHADHVPPKYQPQYLSRTQNKDAPLLNEKFHLLMREARNPDPTSSLVYCFDQHYPPTEDGNVAADHMGLPPAYFQVCGLDMSRDDGLIYERVLREECGLPTRIDLYPGLPHGWWAMKPQLESSKRRMEDAVEGVGWLLSFSGSQSD
jgi:acetyl esterase/lipase